MKLADKIKEQLASEWFTEIYKNKIRPLRTRSYKMPIPEKENKTEIQHTLLGIELKVGKLRLSCPDLSTARYLQIFARLGINEVAIPYEITKISHCADELESSWQKTLLSLEHELKNTNPKLKSKIKAELIKIIRDEVKQIGAGPKIPEFPQQTKQKKSS